MQSTIDARAQADQAPGQPLRLSWSHPQGLINLSFANFVLRIVTLGIYNFWGKTEVRRRIWSAVRLNGEPLAYTGTGKELFAGFLVILAVIFIPTTLLSFAVIYYFGPESPAIGLYQLVLYLFFFFLTGVAIYRAQRYRLSRTNWRGIRGSLVGSDRSYSWLYSWSALLIPITLGWIMPWRSTALQEILTNDTRFGDRAFRFSADPGPLYAPFAVFWIGAAIIIVGAIVAMSGAVGGLVALGQLAEPNPDSPVNTAKILGLLAVLYGVAAIAFLLYYLFSAWYRARQINHFSNHTHFDSAKLRSTVTGGGLIWIAIGNFFLRMAGLLIGILIIGLLVAAGSALMGTADGTLIQAPAEGEPPGMLAQVAIFGGIIILAAAATLFSPIIQARNARYLVENLAIDGDVALDTIAQGADQGIRRGEGLAQAFDVDAF